MDKGNLVDNLLLNGIEACEELDGDGAVEIIVKRKAVS